MADLEPEPHARARRGGVDADPSVARNGFPGACRISSAVPVRTGRSTQIGVVSRKPAASP